MKNELASGSARRIILIALGAVALLSVGVVDYLTGYELSLTALYLGPISLIAWLGGAWAAGVSAIAAALIWAAADIAAGHVYSHPAIEVWNSAMRLAHFALVGLTLAALKQAWRRERAQAREDFLTGIPNSRHFFELAALCAERDRRAGSPTSLAYLDCDNFKLVNDVSGHAVGDEALRVIARTIAATVRSTDIVARIGGDEFAVFLSEADRDRAAEIVRRMVERLAVSVADHGWPISFSVGLVTFERAPALDSAIRHAEAAMRKAKVAGKDMVIHEAPPLAPARARDGRREASGDAAGSPPPDPARNLRPVSGTAS